jgi:hypothetical protein
MPDVEPIYRCRGVLVLYTLGGFGCSLGLDCQAVAILDDARAYRSAHEVVMIESGGPN